MRAMFERLMGVTAPKEDAPARAESEPVEAPSAPIENQTEEPTIEPKQE